jgi:ribonuclease P protein component
MSMNFGPEARLRSHVEFAAVQHGGRRVAARYLTLLGSPNALGRDRLGVIASRRLGGAVVRNRAKRRLREIFRHEAGRDDAARRAYDLVVIPRRECVTAPFQDVRADFHAAVRKMRATRTS